MVGSAFVPRAATAGLLLAGAAAASVKRKREAPQKRYDLVLTCVEIAASTSTP